MIITGKFVILFAYILDVMVNMYESLQKRSYRFLWALFQFLAHLDVPRDYTCILFGMENLKVSILPGFKNIVPMDLPVL